MLIKRIVYSLNDRYYQPAIQAFMLIVGFHFLEHIVQLTQLYLLGWPRSQSMGLLGTVYPWLMMSEWLHYGHALFMMLGLAVFRLSPIAGFWWSLAMWLAFYHHIEHAILLAQFFEGVQMAQRASLGSFLMPRLELHFFYNLMILLPMLIAFRFQRYSRNNRLYLP